MVEVEKFPVKILAKRFDRIERKRFLGKIDAIVSANLDFPIGACLRWVRTHEEPRALRRAKGEQHPRGGGVIEVLERIATQNEVVVAPRKALRQIGGREGRSRLHPWWPARIDEECLDVLLDDRIHDIEARIAKTGDAVEDPSEVERLPEHAAAGGVGERAHAQAINEKLKAK